MTQDQIDKILEALRADPLGPSGHAGITEAYHVDRGGRAAAARVRGAGDVAAEFSCETKSGGEVTVQILDEGRGFEPQWLRYGCRAVKSGRLLVTGNGGATPIKALESVHWGQLEGKLAGTEG